MDRYRYMYLDIRVTIIRYFSPNVCLFSRKNLSLEKITSNVDIYRVEHRVI